MKPGRFLVAVVAVNLLFFILAAAFYSAMPETMTSHWNTEGEANGTLPRFWGLFLMPLLALGLSIILLAIPKIDPLQANIQKFKGTYYGFVAVSLTYLLYIYLLTLLWNLGWTFNFSRAIFPTFGILIFCAGFLLGKTKRNFFIGFRTPWTLISDEVWDRTNRLGGSLFKIAGVIIFLISFLPAVAGYISVAALSFIIVWLIIYSYLIYRRIGRTPQSPRV